MRRERPHGAGQIPANVATPSVSGGCDGTGSTQAADSWVDGQAGQVRPVDRAGCEQLRGVPDGWDQPADRDTLAIRTDRPEHSRGGGAVSAGAHIDADQAAASSVLVPGGADCDRNVDRSGGYLPRSADRIAVERLPRPRKRRLLTDVDLRGVVMELLEKRWSPEQVAHELRERFGDQPHRHLSAESIYQGIYDSDVPVTRPAKRPRRRRRRHTQGLERRGRLTAMTMIADRPAEVDDRVETGHWEGDCIMGSGNRSAIGTLVERRTRYLILIHVPTGRPTAEAMREGITAALGALPAYLRRTLTWDQGKELALHLQISEQTGTRVFFCDAHSPWQRGSNENMNGLLRDYFPKHTDLGRVTPEELQRVAEEVNARPRKSLDWTRPADLIADAITSVTA